MVERGKRASLQSPGDTGNVFGILCSPKVTTAAPPTQLWVMEDTISPSAVRRGNPSLNTFSCQTLFVSCVKVFRQFVAIS